MDLKEKGRFKLNFHLDIYRLFQLYCINPLKILDNYLEQIDTVGVLNHPTYNIDISRIKASGRTLLRSIHSSLNSGYYSESFDDGYH